MHNKHLKAPLTSALAAQGQLSLCLQHTLKRHNRDDLVFAIQETLLTQEHSAIIGILGDSGTGKSTMLKLMAGLIAGAKYQLFFNGKSYDNTLAHTNPCVYVSREAVLFEHLDVTQNILLGRSKGASSNTWPTHRDAELSFEQVVSKCGIAHLLTQRISTLSSGEKQRVQFARALLCNKPIILLDEAFSALDWASRLAMLQIVNELKNSTPLQFIIVSHSLKELAACCTCLYKLDKGGIVYKGNVDEMLGFLRQSGMADNHIASFSTLKAQFVEYDSSDGIAKWKLTDEGVSSEKLSAQYVFSNFDKAASTAHVNTHTFCIDADKISVAKTSDAHTSMLNALHGKVLSIEKGDKNVLLTLLVNGQHLRSSISKRSLQAMDIAVDDYLYAVFKAL